jgi:hypothetical protein
MARPSPEELEAYEKLNEAISNLIRARGWDNSDGNALLLTDWIVVASQTGYDADGDSKTGVVRFDGPNWQMPWTTRMGLHRMGMIMMEEEFRGDGDRSG